MAAEGCKVSPHVLVARSTAEIRSALCELRIQLSLLNYRVASRLELKDGDLDRLERGGWVVRDRDPCDRRAVVVQATRERYAELMRQYSGMSRSMTDDLAGREPS